MALSMHRKKDVLTTGQVARLCNVAPRTVSKWFDNGQLRGYRIPGSKDRRIPVSHLVSFMKSHGMPLNGLDPGTTRVLILDGDSNIHDLLQDAFAHEKGFEITCTSTAFEAGIAAENLKPEVLVVDISLPDVRPAQLCRDLRASPELQSLRVIATSGDMTPGQGQKMLQSGFDAYLTKPFDIQQLIDAISAVLGGGA